MIKRIQTKKAPKVLGTYSQGTSFDNLIFTSGQIGINPSSGELVTKNFEDETYQVLENINSILEYEGSNIHNILKLSVFIIDLNNFKQVNDFFSKFFNGEYPARSVVEVSKLPLDANIEIEAIAIKNEI